MTARRRWMARCVATVVLVAGPAVVATPGTAAAAPATPATAATPAVAGVPVLLSQGKPVAASSVAGCCPAENAVDGRPTTRWASAPGAGQQWISVDLGAPAQPTRVRLEWDTSCAKTFEVQLSRDAVTWRPVHRTGTGDGGVDDLLVNGTGRYVRVLAVQRCRTGASKGYSLREFQVYGSYGEPRPPGPPRDPRLGNLTCVSANITWNPPEDGLTVSAYDVLADGRVLASVDGDTVGTVVTGLTPNTSYRFTVVARDTAGNVSAPSPELAATTPPCGGEPPTVPTGLRVVSVSGGCATLAWQPSVDNVGVVGYHVFADDVPVATITGTTATICRPTPGVPYTAAVSAFDAEGNESARSAPVRVIDPGCGVCAVTTVATSSDVPWGLVTLPDGSILYAERDRFDIVRVAPDGRQTVVGRVPGVAGTNGEGGLTGLEISPTFATDHWLYIFHTSATDNRIVRIRYRNGVLDTAGEQVLVKGIARNRFHNGGRLRFGPDGTLYAGTGDAQVGGNAQNPNSLNGKILRLNPDGTVPADNPFPGSYVWSYGHRNVQGLAFDSHGRLWASELGAATLDEVNLITKGGDHGWPACEGTLGNCAGSVAPVRTFPVTVSPSGIAIVDDVIYLAALRGARLYRMVITGSTTAPPQAYLTGVYGRLRTVEPAPDGGLWLTTSNGDNHLGGVITNRILHVSLTGPQAGPIWSATICADSVDHRQPAAGMGRAADQEQAADRAAVAPAAQAGEAVHGGAVDRAARGARRRPPGRPGCGSRGTATRSRTSSPARRARRGSGRRTRSASPGPVQSTADALSPCGGALTSTNHASCPSGRTAGRRRP